MNFTTNYDDVGTSDILPEGSYECVIKSAALNATKNGTAFFDVRFVIRNDVSQKYQNKCIFHSIWKKKEPSEADKQVDGFSFKQVMALAMAVKIPAGKNYADLDEMGKDLVGKPVLVDIYHDTYNGQTNVRVKYVNESKYPDCKHVYKEAAPTANGQTYAQKPQQQFASAAVPTAPTAVNADLSDFEEVISDSDLPF